MRTRVLVRAGGRHLLVLKPKPKVLKLIVLVEAQMLPQMLLQMPWGKTATPAGPSATQVANDSEMESYVSSDDFVSTR